MPITLPTSPGFASASPTYVDVGAVQRSPMSADAQRLNRLGNHFALEVKMPPMPSAGTAMGWIAALTRAQREGALVEWPQLGFDTGAPGAVKIDAGGAAGTAMALMGLTAGYTLAAGQFVSVIHNGRRYLHLVSSAVVADGAGKATATVEPMVRAIFAQNDVVEVAQPMIEGFLVGDGLPWDIDIARFVGLSFRIEEAA